MIDVRASYSKPKCETSRTMVKLLVYVSACFSSSLVGVSMIYSRPFMCTMDSSDLVSVSIRRKQS